MNSRLVDTLISSDSERRRLVAGARRPGRRLGEYSREYMAARWLSDLEFMVWQDLVDRRVVNDLLVSPEGCILPPLDANEKKEFRRLSKAIGGWVAYDAEDAKDRLEFVPLALWRARFEGWLVRLETAAQSAS